MARKAKTSGMSSDARWYIGCFLFFVGVLLCLYLYKGPVGKLEVRASPVASKELDQLLTTHPSRDMLAEFKQLLGEKKFFLAFDNHRPFTLRDGTAAGGAFFCCTEIPLPGYKGLYPVFTVIESFLFSTEVSDLEKQLGLFHEFQHVKQFLDGRIPQKIFEGQQPETRWIIENQFKSEVEAYLFQARLAHELGFRSTHEPYESYERTGGELIPFQRRIARFIAHMPIHRKHPELLLELAETPQMK